jgi:hypothetical protein
MAKHLTRAITDTSLDWAHISHIGPTPMRPARARRGRHTDLAAQSIHPMVALPAPPRPHPEAMARRLGALRLFVSAQTHTC